MGRHCCEFTQRPHLGTLTHPPQVHERSHQWPPALCNAVVQVLCNSCRVSPTLADYFNGHVANTTVWKDEGRGKTGQGNSQRMDCSLVHLPCNLHFSEWPQLECG
mmetsp:Transcript_72875/g.136149  ORF Transcript_72875/g.136149 Transcript_72875/m.136149 type:complete len:105 (+) Transcript_72875:2-316(+)